MLKNNTFQLRTAVTEFLPIYSRGTIHRTHQFTVVNANGDEN